MSNVWIAANTTWYVVNFRSKLIERLNELGYSITVLSPTDGYVGHLDAMKVRHLPLKIDNGGTDPIADLLTLWRLIRLFRKERPGVLLTYTPKVNIYASIAAQLSRVPVLANVSGLGSGFVRGGWLKMLLQVLYSMAFSRVDKVFFQNAEDQDFFVKYRLVRYGRTERLPGSGVDLVRFAPQGLGDRKLPFVFLMVARLIKDKGVYEYVEAARIVTREFQDVEFRLLGFLDVGNPTAVAAETLDAWRSEQVIRYLGATDDVAPHYAEADCVVLPSYREGCPRSLLEAASVARPVIASDVAGCRQVVDDGITGYLIRPTDPADLAEKMKMMLVLSSSEREAMGFRGRKKMEREFDEQIVISAYVDAIAATLRSRNLAL